MDVFDQAMASRAWLCTCAVVAGHDLGLYAHAGTATEIAAQLGVRPHRLRILLDVLVATGAMRRDGEVYAGAAPPLATEVTRDGWGRIAEVIRSDRPLPLEQGRGYHDHLVAAGGAAARELASHLEGESLLDLGGGAGTYTEAFLDAHPTARATLVDAPEVIALARDRLARFGDRVALVAGDARDDHPRHAIVLLANVLHLHDEATCAAIVAAARHAGGQVVIKDLRVDEDRRGPLEGLLFALGMAIYTDGGDVYRASTIRGWLTGLDVVERRLEASDHLVLVARSPFEGLAYPPAFRRVLDRALADEPSMRDVLVDHYAVRMPAARRDEPAVFARELDWSQLPRLTAAIDNLYTTLAAADVDPAILGARDAAGFRALTPTLSTLYARTHYGGAMPLLYGGPDAIAYFESHGLTPHAVIDRYLVAPLVHELSHLHRDRDGVGSVHLDECLAGWLGVVVHRELAYGNDDALYAAPFLSQIGQAFARRFGVRATLRAHAGIEPLPLELAAIGWADWRARKTVHFLSDTMDPAPWVGLALTGTLARPDLAALELADDAALDRQIVEDAVAAMCLTATRGRPRMSAPGTIELRDGWLTTPRRGDDPITPRYWLPPRVARLGARTLELAALDDLPRVVATLLTSHSSRPRC